MENAANALKMAAAALIFIIAIGTSFSVFGTAKKTADSIIGMRNKQQYLQSAELDKILYTSSNAITQKQGQKDEESDIKNITINGDRIVSVNDVYSTISRYNKEKYGVNIVDGSSGNVLARFDVATESAISSLNLDSNLLEKYKKELSNITKTTYVEKPNFSNLKELYKITTIDNKNEYGAPWLGDNAKIQERINADMFGGICQYNNGIKYEGRGLFSELKDKKIIEVTNEIDVSTYLQDGTETTDLLQQYEMPTVEIIYIIF